MIVNDIHEVSVRARDAFYRISASTAEERNSVLLTLSRLLEEKKGSVFEANDADLAAAKKALEEYKKINPKDEEIILLENEIKY